MATKINIDLEKFDFDYWNNNRIAVLRALIQRSEADNVRTLALIVGLNYASTYNIIMDFQKRKLIVRKARIIRLADNWENIFILVRR